MRKVCILFFSLFLLSSVEAAVHRVGTYNIRYPAESDTLDKAWSKRRDAVCVMIRDTMNFDVVALQEATQSQYNYLKDKLGSTYTFLMGSYYGVALLYRTSKYTCLSKGSFYLAPDPTKSGRAWDAQQTRWTVWAKLKDKVSGEVFVYGATHMDLYPISLREGARVNQEQLMKIAGNDGACMFAGDMNCEQFDHDPHANFGVHFGNARQMSKTEPRGSFYTFSSGMNPQGASKQIDFLYVRNTEVESYFVNNSTLGRSLLPSDHLPLVCEVTVLSPNRKTTHVVKDVPELLEAAHSVQPNDIIYLKDGYYDLGDTTLTFANTCVLEGADDVVMTGRRQLMTGQRFISLEVRNIAFEGATCPVDVNGSIIGLNGNYLKLSDCRFSNNVTDGFGLVYAKDCALDVDHCTFRSNRSNINEGCVYVTGCERYPMSITKSLFVENTAFQAPAVYFISTSAASLSGNSFIGNSAQQHGAVAFVASTSVQTIELLNNTFAHNRIDVLAGFADAAVGGTAIWEELAAKGKLSLVHNTIVGNFTASRDASGVTSRRFKSGAVQVSSGQLSLQKNIIAGNYSSCAGRGDLSVVTASDVKLSEYNIFSSADNMTFTPSSTDFTAPGFATACNELVSFLGGAVVDSLYVPQVLPYGENSDVWTVSPVSTTYARRNVAVINSTACPYDQAGGLRNALTVPGAMEQGAQPTALPYVPASSGEGTARKVLLNGHLYIEHNGRWYNALGL